MTPSQRGRYGYEAARHAPWRAAGECTLFIVFFFLSKQIRLFELLISYMRKTYELHHNRQHDLIIMAIIIIMVMMIIIIPGDECASNAELKLLKSLRA